MIPYYFYLEQFLYILNYIPFICIYIYIRVNFLFSGCFIFYFICLILRNDTYQISVKIFISKIHGGLPFTVLTRMHKPMA